MDIVGIVHPVLLAWQDRADGEGQETATGRGEGGEVLLPHGPGQGDLSQHRQGLPFKVSFILYIRVWRTLNAISYRAARGFPGNSTAPYALEYEKHLHGRLKAHGYSNGRG